MRHSAPIRVRTHRDSLRLAGAAAVGLLLLFIAAPVAADTKAGTVGKYTIVDGGGKSGATCIYTDGYPTHYLVRVSVPAPKAFWPASSGSIPGSTPTARRPPTGRWRPPDGPKRRSSGTSRSDRCTASRFRSKT